MKLAVRGIQSTSYPLLVHARSTHPDVSLPHGRYGRYLCKEQIAELVVPPPDVLELIHAWIGHHNVHPSTISTTHGGSRLALRRFPVSRANDLLNASYQLYQHVGTNETVLRTLSYGLPAVLVLRVQTVVPTTHFGLPLIPRQKPLMRPVGEAGAPEKAAVGERESAPLSRRNPSPYYVTPSLLRWQYQTLGFVPSAQHGNVLGIAVFLNQYPSPDDLSQFMSKYRTDGDFGTFTIVKVNG